MGVLNGISLCKTRRMLKIALVVCAQNANLHQSTATYSPLESFFILVLVAFTHYPSQKKTSAKGQKMRKTAYCVRDSYFSLSVMHLVGF